MTPTSPMRWENHWKSWKPSKFNLIKSWFPHPWLEDHWPENPCSVYCPQHASHPINSKLTRPTLQQQISQLCPFWTNYFSSLQNVDFMSFPWKFKLLAFWRKKTPFINQKCTYEKVPKKLGRAPPPRSFGQNPKEQQFFFGTPSLNAYSMCSV